MDLHIFAFILLIIFTIEIVFVFIMGASRIKRGEPDLIFNGPPPSIFPPLPQPGRGGPGSGAGGQWGPGSGAGGQWGPGSGAGGQWGPGSGAGGQWGPVGPGPWPGSHGRPGNRPINRHHHGHHHGPGGDGGGGGGGGHSSGKLKKNLVFSITDTTGTTRTPIPILSVPVSTFNGRDTLKQDFSKISSQNPTARVSVRYYPSNIDLHWVLSNGTNVKPLKGTGRKGQMHLGTVGKIQSLLKNNDTSLQFRIRTN